GRRARRPGRGQRPPSPAAIRSKAPSAWPWHDPTPPAFGPPQCPVLAACIAGPVSLGCAASRAPVPQLERASDYGSEGSEFDSLRARQFFKNLATDDAIAIGAWPHRGTTGNQLWAGPVSS